ncbi:MAG: RimK/LysX family protein, partial [Bacteroidota bacterium]
ALSALSAMPSPSTSPSSLVTVGWREWVALPELGLLAVRAKVDTGAATSALHAFDVHTERDGGALVARFRAKPIRTPATLVVDCVAPVVDQREVTSSSGHSELRVVIGTQLRLGTKADAPTWGIEVTLTDRSLLRFPMLLGREAMEGAVLVNPGASDLLGRVLTPDLFYSR